MTPASERVNIAIRIDSNKGKRLSWLFMLLTSQTIGDPPSLANKMLNMKALNLTIIFQSECVPTHESGKCMKTIPRRIGKKKSLKKRTSKPLSAMAL
jgi:hypothetical protein